MRTRRPRFRTVSLQSEISYQNRPRFAIVIDVARVCGMFWAARAVCVALTIELAAAQSASLRVGQPADYNGKESD